MRTAFLIVITFAASLVGFAQTSSMADANSDIAAPPVINEITDHSAELLWNTRTTSATRVRYGTEADNLTQVATRPTAQKEHEIVINGLQPHKTYYYEIETRSGQKPLTGSFTTR